MREMKNTCEYALNTSQICGFIGQHEKSLTTPSKELIQQ